MPPPPLSSPPGQRSPRQVHMWFANGERLARFPNPLAPHPDTCQLGNPTRSSPGQVHMWCGALLASPHIQPTPNPHMCFSEQDVFFFNSHPRLLSVRVNAIVILLLAEQGRELTCRQWRESLQLVINSEHPTALCLSQ